MSTVRLDVVVKVKEREEDARLDALARALRRVEAAKAALRKAEAEASSDVRGRGVAADYCLYEAAWARAQEAVRHARAALDAAQRAAEEARAAWMHARSRAEAVRRVADARRAEVRQRDAARERRVSDELTLLRYAWAG